VAKHTHRMRHLAWIGIVSLILSCAPAWAGNERGTSSGPATAKGSAPPDLYLHVQAAKPAILASAKLASLP